jgi:hypothetical protein
MTTQRGYDPRSESFAVWEEFYGAIRDAYWVSRPTLRDKSACERLYQAWLRGEDCDAVRDQIDAERAADDPRRVLLGERYAP